MASSSWEVGPALSNNEETRVPVLNIGEHLHDRLGPAPALDLMQTLNAAQLETLTLAGERFDARLTATCAQLRAELREEIVNGDASIRVALVEGLSQIRKEMGDLRVDVLRWSFLFWLGQVAAIGTMFTILLRALGR
jgi:hypothetical protein